MYAFSHSNICIREHTNSVVVVFRVPSSSLRQHSSSSSLSSCFFLDLHLVSLPVSILSNFISLNTFFYCAYTHTHTLFIMVCTSQCLSMFLMDVEEIGHKPVIYLWHMNILPLCYKKIHSPLFNYIILFTFHILSSYYVRSSCAIASLLNIY